MPTAIFNCGFECRLTAAGHWTSLLAGTVQSIQNTYARNGGYALRQTVTADDCFAQSNFVANTTTVVARVYLYFVTLPAGNVNSLIDIEMPSWHYAVGFNQATGKLDIGISGGTKQDGPSVSAGVWYRIDLKLNSSANPHLLDWQVDGVAQTQFSNPVALANSYYLILGNKVTTTQSWDVVFDDVMVSQTAGDYPIGPGKTIGYPILSTSGTHNQTAGDLQNEASTNITNADSSGDKVNEATADTTSYVKQVVARNTSYWEGVYGTSGATEVPRVVEQIVATRAVTAGANDQKAQLYDGTSAADAYALVSTPNVTLLTSRKTWNTAPSTGAWTLGKLQAARIRWGFGSTNTATYPPAISWTLLEAEFDDTATGPVWTTPADTASMSTTPELKFTSPASAVAQHFYLELDTANTFDTGNLRTYRSDMNQTNWDYWDGGAWVAMPSTGLPSNMAGNEIRYTVTDALSAATWYRRVRAGV